MGNIIKKGHDKKIKIIIIITIIFGIITLVGSSTYIINKDKYDCIKHENYGHNLLSNYDQKVPKNKYQCKFSSEKVQYLKTSREVENYISILMLVLISNIILLVVVVRLLDKNKTKNKLITINTGLIIINLILIYLFSGAGYFYN